MEVRVSNVELRDCMKEVRKGNKGPQVTEHMKNVLIRVGYDGCSVVGTNAKSTIAVSFRGNVTEDGECAVDSALFAGIADRLPDGMCTLKSDGKRLSFKSGKFKASLSEYPTREFVLPDAVVPVSEVSMPGRKLADLLNKVGYAMATDETRTNLCGTYLVFAESNAVKAVALDGFRMSISEATDVTVSGKEQGVIIPLVSAKAIAQLASGEKENIVTVRTDGKKVEYRGKDTVFTSALVSGEYVDYARLRNQPVNCVVRVRVAEMLPALERAAVANGTNPVRLLVNSDGVVISANGSIADNVEELEMPVRFENGTEEIRIAFNLNYLRECLSAVTEEETDLCFNTGVTPATINTDGGDFHMLLPVRIQGA